MSPLIAFVTADEALLARVRELLATHGCRVVAAGSGSLPLPLADTPDLVLVDASLPDREAASFVDALARSSSPRQPVLVLAERSRAEAALAALRAGADDALFTPLDPWGLPLRIEGLLARRRAEDAAEQVKTLEFRNQELESFIYIVTHDMKTPVVNLQGLVGLIEQDHSGQLPEQVSGYLGRLKRNAERLEQLLHDLLEYPRRLRVLGPRQLHAIGPVVEAAVDGLQELARASGVDVVVAADLPAVSCDAKRLQQVFHNLVENAVKYSAGRPRARVEIGWATTPQGPRFHVKDNGPGIPKEHVQDVFKLFHRVPGSAADGTGIGLAVARQLVEAHGGEIWCESNPGEGATFFFSLGR